MSETNEVARVLRDAADLIEPPGRWIKGSWARDAEGLSVEPESPSAVCWCAEGAIRRASYADFYQALDAARNVQAFVGRGIIGWNDEQKSAESVVAALRAAADEAERAS